MPTIKALPLSNLPPATETQNPTLLPHTWLQLSKPARRAFLLLALQENSNLFYSNRHLGLLQELASYILVEQTTTQVGGRLWRITSAGFELLFALPDTEDARLKWIQALHRSNSTK